MSEQSTEWAARAAGLRANAGELAIAQLAEENLLGRGGLALTSPAFAPGGELDPSFSAYEEDAVAPPLEWTAPPPATQELALIVQSVDEDGRQLTLHWLVWGLKPQRGKLLEGEVPPRTGKNGRGNSEWLLPEPPVGERHHYIFQLFALDLPLTLMPGATQDDLYAEIRGHVVGCAVLNASFVGQTADDDFIFDEGEG